MESKLRRIEDIIIDINKLTEFETITFDSITEFTQITREVSLILQDEKYEIFTQLIIELNEVSKQIKFKYKKINCYESKPGFNCFSIWTV